MPDEPRIDAIRAVTGAVFDRLDPGRTRIFLHEILSWNEHLGLVSRRDPVAVIARLMCRSVRLWDCVEAHGTPDSNVRVADIGPGAGFPGVVWTLLSPRPQVTLIERKTRRAVFLERLATRLPRLTVVEAEAETLAADPGHRGRYGVVTMLAVADPAAISGAISPLLAPAGLLANVRSALTGAAPHELDGGMALVGEWIENDGRYVLYQRTPG